MTAIRTSPDVDLRRQSTGRGPLGAGASKVERVGEMADPLALLSPRPTCDGAVDGWAPTDFENSGAPELLDAPA